MQSTLCTQSHLTPQEYLEVGAVPGVWFQNRSWGTSHEGELPGSQGAWTPTHVCLSAGLWPICSPEGVRLDRDGTGRKGQALSQKCGQRLSRPHSPGSIREDLIYWVLCKLPDLSDTELSPLRWGKSASLASVVVIVE